MWYFILVICLINEIHISRGNVGTCFRCGGDDNYIANFLMSVWMKEVKKSFGIWWIMTEKRVNRQCTFWLTVYKPKLQVFRCVVDLLYNKSKFVQQIRSLELIHRTLQICHTKSHFSYVQNHEFCQKLYFLSKFCPAIEMYLISKWTIVY